MKRIILMLLLAVCFCFKASAQEKTQIENAVLDYVEGFYEGDTTRITRSINLDLSKFGYGYDEDSKSYKGYPMSFDDAINYALDVKNNSDYAAPPNAIKRIEILDAQDKIASVKLTAYWGIDYLLLAKYDNKWMVTKVLWQSIQSQQ